MHLSEVAPHGGSVLTAPPGLDGAAYQGSPRLRVSSAMPCQALQVKRISIVRIKAEGVIIESFSPVWVCRVKCCPLEDERMSF